MKTWVRVALLMTLLSGIAVSGYIVGVRTDLFMVQDPKLKILDETDRYYSAVVSKLESQLAQFGNTKIWNVDVASLGGILQKQAWIEQHLIQRTFPNQIRIEVKPKKVAVIFISRIGRIIPISYDGAILPEVDLKDAPNAPVIRDVIFLKDIKVRQSLMQLMTELPISGPLSRESIAEIQLEKTNQFLVSLSQSGIQVRIGVENIPLKVARVTKVLEYLQSNNVQARVIDADFSKKVLVKLHHRH